MAAFQVENAGIAAHCGRWCERSGLEWGLLTKVVGLCGEGRGVVMGERMEGDVM